MVVTAEEIERQLGAQVRALRLAIDLDQRTLADNANVGVSALRNLEAGRGVSLRTLVRVVRALGRGDWFEDLYPEPEVSPLALARAQAGERVPKRASKRRRET